MMPAQLTIALSIPTSEVALNNIHVYNNDTDDIRSILLDVCRAIPKEGYFTVSGFGQSQWPVDVRTDLAVFLEQLPEVLRAVRAGEATEIDFYEQGVERKIEMVPAGDVYRATCVSHAGWQPNPSVEEVDRAALERMLMAVQREVTGFITLVAPEIAAHEWVREWLAGAGKRP